MDREITQYTSETRRWLNKRFDLFDADDEYIPNQPAYGFSALSFRLEEYARMYSVLRILNGLSFSNLLDIGCADGYGPAIIRYLFDVNVVGLDLSDRALVRGREMFMVKGAAADAQSLPFSDKSFDATLCTEVLEHVVDPEKVISEMIRVSRKFVLFSTPRAADEAARKKHFETLDPNEPHAHIHYFTDPEIKALAGSNAWFLGARSRYINIVLDRIAWGDETTLTQRESYFKFTIESANIGDDYSKEIRNMLLDRYKRTASWKKSVMNPVVAGWLLTLDAVIAARKPSLSLDHLVLIPVSDCENPVKNRISRQRILKELLGGFHVKPLKKDRI
ncbi:class I SAM-dependent methyltransferase [bacterium]|nr:class I SAM-dependent methyltransferase [bacterium]